MPGKAGDPGVTAKDNRRFINAVLWVARTGAPREDLPERFGRPNSVWRRFDRWATKGAWARVFRELQDPDLEWLLLDSTVLRAHQHAAGRRGGQQDEVLGRSRGGFSTKLHVAVEGLGNPAELHLSAGQEADVTHAPALLADHRPGAVIADKGYDSAGLVDLIEARGATAVIPTQKTRAVQRVIDPVRYRERNLAERFLSRAEHYRRVATRYDKKARNCLALVQVAAVMVLLR